MLKQPRINKMIEYGGLASLCSVTSLAIGDENSIIAVVSNLLCYAIAKLGKFRSF